MLIVGGRLALAARVKCMKAHSDYQLIVSQVSENYETREERMTNYLSKIRELQKFENFTLEQIPQSENEEDD